MTIIPNVIVKFNKRIKVVKGKFVKYLFEEVDFEHQQHHVKFRLLLQLNFHEMQECTHKKNEGSNTKISQISSLSKD